VCADYQNKRARMVWFRANLVRYRTMLSLQSGHSHGRIATESGEAELISALAARWGQ
jgi:hypothetical protein